MLETIYLLPRTVIVPVFWLSECERVLQAAFNIQKKALDPADALCEPENYSAANLAAWRVIGLVENYIHIALT